MDPLFDELFTDIENVQEFDISEFFSDTLFDLPNIPDVKVTPVDFTQYFQGVVTPDITDFHWCIKKGGKRGNQFWVYCEKSQNNYARITITADGLIISSNSAIMKDEDESLFIVEDTRLETVKCFPLSGAYLSVVQYARSRLSPTAAADFHIQISLLPDKDYPRHPYQGQATDVKFSFRQIPVGGDLQQPLSFFYEINFQGRTKGWFRLKHTLSYRGKVISEGFSETFMFNNPRMKKLPEHQKYSPDELKFMHLYSHTLNKQDFIMQYRNSTPNTNILFQNAERLFPKSQRSVNICKQAPCV